MDGSFEGRPESGLRGRRTECRALARLLDGMRASQSTVLLLRGAAGSGKTALLEYVLEQASGCRIARVGGVESEMELAFAGLQQFCVPMLDRLAHLPVPQRNALQSAFGLREGSAPDRFLVGLAVLSLLSEIAEERPLVCLVDDVQWLDRASVGALAFASRRLMAEPVCMVFAVREPSDERALIGLPEMVLGGLDDADARLLLSSAIRGRLDEQVRDRIVAEARGNPLALLEFPRVLTAVDLAGGFGHPDARPLASRIEQSFHHRLQSLPDETQRLLLTAAAEPVGDVTLLWRAAARLGIGTGAAVAAQTEGLLELGSRVRFRHPLVRSVVYRSAPLSDRQAVHEALAEATDLELDPDRRAWHRAHAAPGPNETVAEELERSAERARARGGVAAAGAFLEWATRLTPDPARRGARALAAAQAKFEAGAPDAAREMLATAEMGPLDDLQGARLARLRGQLAFTESRGRDAPPQLLNAAKRLEPLDAALARETYLEAFGAAIFAGRLIGGNGLMEVASAAHAAPSAPEPARPIDRLMAGLATRFTEGYPAGVPPLKRALHAFRREEGRSEDDMRWLWLACRIASDLWDDEAWHELASREVRLTRDAGALTVLPIALTYRAGVHVHAGEFAAASALVDEAVGITEATGSPRLLYTSLVLDAWRGREAEVVGLIVAGLHDATARGEGRAIAVAEYASAVLYNGLGRFQDALAAAERACAHDDLGLLGWSLTELVEAGAGTGQLEVAGIALERLAERTSASGTEWALGIEARSRALLGDGTAADALYREAIERLARSRITVQLARSHLLYGEWLRRQHRRPHAREQLHQAHDMFSSIGAEAFAERASRELMATGETVLKRASDTRDDLTAQESQIARLARDGLTNPEIGAQLFISPRTVEWHLGKVFLKLRVTSRRELREVLPVGERAVPA